MRRLGISESCFSVQELQRHSLSAVLPCLLLVRDFVREREQPSPKVHVKVVTVDGQRRLRRVVGQAAFVQKASRHWLGLTKHLTRV